MITLFDLQGWERFEKGGRRPPPLAYSIASRHSRFQLRAEPRISPSSWIFQPLHRPGCDEDRPGNKPSGHSLCPKQNAGSTNGDLDCTWGGQFRGLCAVGTRSLLTGYIPCQGRGHAHAAPYLPGCETIISEVGVMHDDRPRPPHPNTPCPSPECCRASTGSQLGTGELLPQQPFSLFLSLVLVRANL